MLAYIYLSQHMVLERNYSALHRVGISIAIIPTHGIKNLGVFLGGTGGEGGGLIDKIAKTLNYRKFRSIDENTKQFAYQCLN